MAKKTNCVINGIQYYRLRATVGHEEDGTPIKKPFYGSCKKEAEEKRDEYLQQLKEEAKKADAELEYTIGELSHIWMYEVRRMDNRIKKTSYERYERLYRAYLKDSPLASLPMATPKLGLIIQRHLNDLYETQNKTPAMLRDAYKIIHMFFIYALKMEYVDKDPCLSVVIPGEKAKKIKLDPFTDNEILSLKTALNGHRLRFFFLLGLGCGFRMGELLALKYNDFYTTDEGKTFVRISKSSANVVDIDAEGNRSNYRNEVWEPKSETSSRDVPLPSGLISELALHKRVQAEELLSIGAGKAELVFTTPVGTAIDQSNIAKQYKKILKLACIRYRKPHMLRHTYGTNLAAKGVDLITIMELMGHNDIKTTMIYLHPKIENKIEAAESLNYMFG